MLLPGPAQIGLAGAVTQLVPTTVRTTNSNAAANDLVICDTTAGGFTVTLPTAPADQTVIGVLLALQSGSNAVTVAAGGSDVFNKAGVTTETISILNNCLIFQYKASAATWYVLSGLGASAPSSAFAQLYDSILAAPAASFDITSISQAYNHLTLITKLRNDGAGTGVGNVNIRFNNDSGANYDDQYIFGSSVSASANGDTAATSIGAAMQEVNGGGTANTFFANRATVISYTDATWKELVSDGFGFATVGTVGTRSMIAGGGMWRSTAAITRITILPGAGSNYVAGSRVTLYGML